MMNICACGCGKQIQAKSTWAKGHNPNKTKDRFDWSSVIEDYKKFGTLERVAEKYGCTLQAVYNQLSKRGVDTSLGFVDWSNVIGDYKKIKSTHKLAKMYNCEPSTVANKLKQLGVELTHDNKSMDVSTGLGRFGEKIALRLLSGSKDMNSVKINYPYDIEWDGWKIDVKISKPRKRHKKPQYSFSTRSKECDFYFLISLNDDNFPEKFLLIPRESIKTIGMTYTVGLESKWDKYEIKFNDEKVIEAVKAAKMEGRHEDREVI